MVGRMATSEHGTPLAVWDVSQPGWFEWKYHQAASDWALAHGGDDDTYRYEIHQAASPYARIFRYALNEKGRFFDPETGGAARAEPEMVTLDELPPGHLMLR
jgi:hypothetical protein